MSEEATVTKPARKPKAEEVLVVKQDTVIKRDTNPDSLLMMAVDKDLNIEKLEKLIDLQERWNAKKAKEAYIQAFSKFQSIVPELKKNKQADFGEGKAKYGFHQLPAIEKAIRPALAECGLSYRWDQKDGDGGKIDVVCIVSHQNGHEERSTPLSGLADSTGSKNIIQARASTISYLRRYTLTGILGLSSADNDDDGAGGKPDENLKGLPRLKDTQLSGAIKSIMEVTRTVEIIKKHVLLNPGQESALMKAEEEAKKSPDYEKKLKALMESIENQNAQKP